MLQSTFAEEATNGQIHRVVGGNHIHAPDVNLLFQQPVTNAEMRTRVALDISLLIRLFTKERIFVPASMDEQNIAVLYIGALLDVLRCEKSNIVEHVTQVNDHAWSVAPLDGNLVNGLAFGHKMARRIQMRAHVVRCLDILSVDSMLRFTFDIFHFKRWVEGPERTILIQVLG